MTTITVGVLALQGAFVEHIQLLRRAAESIVQNGPRKALHEPPHFTFLEVRNTDELQACDALILPGGESTSISLIAERTALLDPLRDFVKVQRKPVWGSTLR